MGTFPKIIRLMVGILATLGLPSMATALLNIDGSRNQIFVFGSVTFGYDSNIFSNAGGGGDYSTSAQVGAELKRRAGIIAVNARFSLERQMFSKFHEESSTNPSFYLELNKTSGRTTGAFTVNAFRVSRPDSAVNIRTNSWNYPLGLSIKYPINDHLYATLQSTYLHRNYADNISLANYTDYSGGLDLFYVFTSKLDLFAGYRYRSASTTFRTRATDHAINFGATGGLLPKLNGMIRLGYQTRGMRGTNDSFSQISAAAAVTWNATRKFTLTGQVSRDFVTTATADNIDTFSCNLRGTYVFSRRFEVDAGLGYGRNLFLDGSQVNRRDEFFFWDAGARFTVNEHLKIALNYTWLRNRSTFNFSDFQRSGYSLEISSRF